MTQDFTLSELTEFVQNEEKMLVELGLKEEKLQVSNEVMNSILNYSKSLSVRKSKYISNIEMVLN